MSGYRVDGGQAGHMAASLINFTRPSSLDSPLSRERLHEPAINVATPWRSIYSYPIE
jgi:hypothetical protein